VTIRRLNTFAEIAPEYDGFILDLWGVIHDGSTAYPGVADTLRRLKLAGKRTVLLSNAPRRAFALVEGMTRMGIPRELYGEVMSSGEAVHLELATRRDPWYAGLGRRMIHLGPERDRNVFDELDLDEVTMPVEADFVLNTGPLSFEDTAEQYIPQLEALAEQKLPMICANPDHVVIREGKRVVCAGALAALYEKMGCEVSYRGKPDPAIYAACLDLLGITDRARLAAVGDALHTDIAGATGAGIDSIFVTGGIHGEELGVRYGQLPDPARLEAVCRSHGQTPTAAIGGFWW
jgi:HAD superfamily hydrolase (TIGR01459 family)